MRGYVSDAANEGGAAAIEADGHPPTPVAGPFSKPIPNVLVLDNVPACPENPPPTAFLPAAPGCLCLPVVPRALTRSGTGNRTPRCVPSVRHAERGCGKRNR